MQRAFATNICSDTTILQILECFVIAIGLLIVFYILALGYIKLQMPRKKPLPFVSKYLFYASTLLTILQFVGFSFTITICRVNNIPKQWSYITTIISFTVYGIIISHLFFCWLSKLYLTFNRSVYEKSRSFYITMNTLFTLLILFAIIGSVTCVLSIRYGAIFLIISEIGYFAISIFLLQVFLRQILHLVTCRIVTVRKVKSVASLRRATNTINLSSQDEKFIACITKYFVLGSVSFMSTLLVLITMTLLVFFDINSLLHILQIFILIDVTINTLCVYLQFNFADCTYKKLFGFCDETVHSKIELKATIELRDANMTFYSDQFRPSITGIPNMNNNGKSKSIQMNVESPASMQTPNIDVKSPISTKNGSSVIGCESAIKSDFSTNSIPIQVFVTYAELADRSRTSSVDSQYASDTEKPVNNNISKKNVVNLSPIPGSPENMNQKSYNVVVNVVSETKTNDKSNEQI